MKKLIVKYGLLSTAQIGLNAHLPASYQSENSEIISISSRDSKKAKSVAEKHNIPKWYGSYEEQIIDSEVDAIINSLPNNMHCEWTIKAAEAGKHILCEKPLAISVKECKKMIDAAKANNVVLVEAFTHRWNHHLRKAKELIASNKIGDISTLDASLCFNSDPKGNIRFSKDLAGGSLWDAGCYAVYAARFVMSEEPVRVFGIAHDNGNWGIDTSFVGTLEFKSGAIANITSGMIQPFRCQISIDGSDGRIEIPGMFDDSGPIIIKYGNGREGQNDNVISTPSPYRFTVQFNEFSECVLSGKEPDFPPEDGMRNTRVIEALYQSSATGKVVEI